MLQYKVLVQRTATPSRPQTNEQTEKDNLVCGRGNQRQED